MRLLVFTEWRLRVVAARELVEKTGDGVGELVTHLSAFLSAMAERCLCLLAAIETGRAKQQESFSERRHDRVVLVDDGRDAGDEPDLALPMQSTAAFSSDMPCPSPVVDLAASSERFGSSLPMHGENGAEVFEDNDPEVADLTEQASSRITGSLLAWCPREQCRSRERCGWMDVGKPVEWCE
jgi:hypothetical protein